MCWFKLGVCRIFPDISGSDTGYPDIKFEKYTGYPDNKFEKYTGYPDIKFEKYTGYPIYPVLSGYFSRYPDIFTRF